MLVSLWLWASQNVTNGDLSDCTDRAIAEAAEYKRKPEVFVTALIKTKWLDEDRKLHDWEEYATLLNDCAEQQKQKTRERVKRHRDRKKAASGSTVTAECNGGDNEVPENNGDCNGECNVTDTLSNAPTTPYHTIPYHTNTLTGAGGDIAHEASETELAKIGLKPGEYLGVTRERVKKVNRDAEVLFRKYRPAVPPTPLDCRMVFLLADSQGDCQLVDYAFQQAQAAGKVNDWRYIAGVIRTLRSRNITTVEQAVKWDEERPDLTGEESLEAMNNLLQKCGVDVE